MTKSGSGDRKYFWVRIIRAGRRYLINSPLYLAGPKGDSQKNSKTSEGETVMTSSWQHHLGAAIYCRTLTKERDSRVSLEQFSTKSDLSQNL